MDVSIDKGKLVIKIEMATEQTPSKTGKTLLVASSRGPVNTSVIDPVTGKNITVSVNAYVKQ